MIAEIRKVEPRGEQAAPGIPKLVTLDELAKIWSVPVNWLRHHCRSTCADPLPTFKMGKYQRVDLNDSALAEWLSRRRSQARGVSR